MWSGMSRPDFVSFPKIPRLKRGIVITEKIDGTNAQVHITADGELFVGSRNRWITQEQDNYGFAKWAYANKEELLKLGPGTHYGEWWGVGIQRGYNHPKTFSLFNTGRWKVVDGVPNYPSCCSVVPVLYAGDWSVNAIEECLGKLRKEGSVAVPGFMKPEGVVVYHAASGNLFKVLLENDELPKGKVTFGESQIVDPR
jgi:hypothetical protein